MWETTSKRVKISFVGLSNSSVNTDDDYCTDKLKVFTDYFYKIE